MDPEGTGDMSDENEWMHDEAEPELSNQEPNASRAMSAYKAEQICIYHLQEIARKCCERTGIPAPFGSWHEIEYVEARAVPMALPASMPTILPPANKPALRPTPKTHPAWIAAALVVGVLIWASYEDGMENSFSGWLINSEREKAKRRARNCCRIIWEEHRRAVERAQKTFRKRSIKTNDNARRKRRRTVSRRN